MHPHYEPGEGYLEGQDSIPDQLIQLLLSFLVMLTLHGSVNMTRNLHMIKQET
jgi:hypothetical protein